MNVEQRIPQFGSEMAAQDHAEQQTATAAGYGQSVSIHLRLLTKFGKFAFIVLIQLFVLFGVGGSAIPPKELRLNGMASIVDGWHFNLVTWEIDALWQKLRAAVIQPSFELDYSTSVIMVREYLARAKEMQALEQAINDRLSGRLNEQSDQRLATEHPSSQAQQENSDHDQTTLDLLRQEQIASRMTVEQIIERQISSALLAEGLSLWGQAFPPVQFAFVEPPRKLVVSPRNRITTDYSRMLDASMSLEAIQEAEATYLARYNQSAYITNIGGLGAFPTMVVDQASLEWILSTVAHEWTHNYLTLYPLGFNYLTNADFITMNETVAEIVGNELGERALQTFYPAVTAPTAGEIPAERDEQQLFSEEQPFDFRKEMRETRLAVDQLLAIGKVEDAERYMEARRRYFVENGYALRVLNQAYFAFHGSYGTSAASTSPIGPKLEALRAQSPDLKTFLTTVRSFTSPDEIDQALARNR